MDFPRLEGARRASGRRGKSKPTPTALPAEALMINNTNYAHWDRLKAKSLDAQFSHEMMTGLNCSPFEADAIVEKVHEVYSPFWDDSPGLRPGQIQMVVVDASVAPNVALRKAKQRVVTLTLHAGTEDLDFRKNRSVPALRRKRLCRMAEKPSSKGDC